MIWRRLVFGLLLLGTIILFWLAHSPFIHSFIHYLDHFSWLLLVTPVGRLRGSLSIDQTV